MEGDTFQEMQEFSILPHQGSCTQEIRWNENDTRMLLDLYTKHKPMVGSLKMRTIKQMWQIVAAELQREVGVIISPPQCENRWKVLDRNYKKYIANQNSTGAGRKQFEYAEDMEKILGKKSVNPQILLTSQATHIPKNIYQEDIENMGANNNYSVQKSAHNNDFCSESTVSKPNTYRKKYLKRKSNLLENMRKDRQIYFEKKIQIEKEKLELLKKRNQIMEERNRIIRECCKCVCKQSELLSS